MFAMISRFVTTASLVALGFASVSPVLGAEPPPPMPASSGEDWYLTLGVRGTLMPDYSGSDDYTVRPGLVLRLAKASKLNDFRSVDDNPSLALYDTGTFRIGVVGRLDLGRDESDNARLTGLGDVDTAVQLGGFTEWYPVDWLRLRGELRYGFGGYDALVGNLGADYIVPFDAWRFAIGPRLSFAGSGYNQAYFGVTPSQSLSASFLGNPLPVYSAGGGLNTVGVTAQLDRNFGNGFLGGVFASYGRLVGDAADSPLTQNANQFSVGLSVAYTFNIGKAWW